MKKSLIALAVLAASGVAMAQSSVTLSGSINGGIIKSGAVDSKAVGGSFGGGANAINIVSNEDLGGGLRGGFNGQMRFNAATGDVNSAGTGNALFHAANVYISGGFGHFAVGKIAEDSNCAFDPWGCIGTGSVIAGAGMSALTAAQTQAQSVRYAIPTIAGFSASYQTTVSTRSNERTVLNLSYANGPIAAQYLQANGNLNVAANGALGAAAALPADADAQETSIAASYNFGVAKLNVFNAKKENAAGTVTSDITGLTASAPMGAATLLASYGKDKKQASNADTSYGFGVNYSLSKRTTLGADLFKREGVGRDTGFALRARHTF